MEMTLSTGRGIDVKDDPDRKTRKPPVRVGVAHHSPAIRNGVAVILEGGPGLELVGAAASADELIQVVDQWCPDLVVMEAAIAAGYERAAHRLACAVPPIPVLCLYTTESAKYRQLPYPGWCTAGCVSEDVEPEVLIGAVVAAAHGYWIGRRPTVHGIHHAEGDLDHHHQPRRPLSPRESEVLRSLTHGMSTKMLAQRLGISEKTVRNHISSIREKLGMRDRGQLMRHAILSALIDPGHVAS